jgi:hypothetical protein
VSFVGYPDGQRLSVWSAPTFASGNAIPVGHGYASDYVNCSQYACMGGFMESTVLPATVQVSWYADAAGQVPTSYRVFTLNNNPLQRAFVNLLNMGSWVQVNVSGIGGTTATLSLALFLTNHQHALDFIPFSAALLDENVSVPGGTVDYYYPGELYSGPVQFNFVNTAAGEFGFQYLTTTGTWDNFWVSNIVSTTDQWYTYPVLVPDSAWRVFVNNTTGAAANYAFTVISSTTGAT